MFHMTRTVYFKAQELGELLAASEECKALEKAEAAGQLDKALSACVAEYAQSREELEELTRAEEKDFPKIGALTRELDDITERMHALPAYQAIIAARADFDAMMQAVNDVVQSALNPDAAGGCSGNCQGCSGCAHRG